MLLPPRLHEISSRLEDLVKSSVDFVRLDYWICGIVFQLAVVCIKQNAPEFDQRQGSLAIVRGTVSKILLYDSMGATVEMLWERDEA